jgi:hypothetical protein
MSYDNTCVRIGTASSKARSEIRLNGSHAWYGVAKPSIKALHIYKILPRNPAFFLILNIY